jgi:hypothetical protein
MTSSWKRGGRHVAVSVLVLLAGCGGGDQGAGGAPAPPGSLLMVNSTTYTVTQLFGSPASAGAWGPNQLTISVPPSGSMMLTDIPAGSYDFKAVASDGTTSWQTNAVSITAGETSTWTLLTPTTGSLQVVNGTTSTIAQLVVSPASAGTWGPNQLASSIAPGGSFTITNIAVGTYDFKAIASDGTTSWQTNSVTITAGGIITWSLR